MREVAAVFLKLGIIGFGGPAAHLAMMEEEVGRKRRWLDREHFLDIAVLRFRVGAMWVVLGGALFGWVLL